jgi:hypothetical protein
MIGEKEKKSSAKTHQEEEGDIPVASPPHADGFLSPFPGKPEDITFRVCALLISR